MWSRAKLRKERGPRKINDQLSAARGEKEGQGADKMKRKSINMSMSLRKKKRKSFQPVHI